MRIIGDIATVSDAGLHEQNPVEVLNEELTRLAIKYGLRPNHFTFHVEAERRGPYASARVKLLLPSKSELSNVVKDAVEPWVRDLAATKPARKCFNYSQGDTIFSIAYDTSQPYRSWGHLTYTVAASLTKNPLYRALKAKVRQLREAPADMVRLLIVCDGDCNLLHDSNLGAHDFDSRQVAEDFLRQNRTIDFILIVTVVERWFGVGRTRACQMKFDLVAAPVGSRSHRVTDAAIVNADALMRRIGARVPQPVRMPHNALNRCHMPGPGPEQLGGYELSGNRIKISSRGLQRLLAGELTIDEFLVAHGWDRERENPFRRAWANGQMITSIEVEDGGERDDDRLAFIFGPPDPAAGPLIGPRDTTDDEEATG